MKQNMKKTIQQLLTFSLVLPLMGCAPATLHSITHGSDTSASNGVVAEYSAVTDHAHALGEAAADGTWQATAENLEGYLSYGPNVDNLPLGRLQARIHLILVDKYQGISGIIKWVLKNLLSKVSILTIDVYSYTENKVLETKTYTGAVLADLMKEASEKGLPIEFNNLKKQSLEFRVYCFGRIPLKHLKTRILKISDQINETAAQL